jgi:RNA polymerase sigma-70 factor, ECF subfamily
MTDTEFREAFHAHRDVLFRFTYRMTGSASEAEEMVQDCFLALWRKPRAYDPSRGSLRSFLLGAARNQVLKRWRDQRRHESLDHETPCDTFLDLEAKERAAAVSRAVLSLPPLQREALVLAEYEELSLEEIARVTGAEIAGVKSRLHRARENLQRMLAPLLESVYGTRS